MSYKSENKTYWFLFFSILFMETSCSHKKIDEIYNLEGIFCNTELSSNSYIKFKQSNRFEFSYSECFYSSFGKGIYKLDDKNLWLFFDKTKEEICSIDIKKLTSDSPHLDSITLYINAIYKDLRFQSDDSPICGILLKNRKEDKYKSYTSENNNFTIKLPFKNQRTYFDICNVRSKNMSFDIDQRFSYKISVTFAPKDFKTILEDTIHYKLKNITQDYFITDDNIKFERKIKSND